MKKYLFLLCSFSVCISAYANERLIIKYKETKAQQKLINSGAMTPKQMRQQMMLPLSSSTIAKLRTYAGVPIVEVNQIATGAHVIDLHGNLTESTVNTIIQKIKLDPAIEYVEVDQILKPMAMPIYNPKQWDMVESIKGDNFQSLQTTWVNDISLTESPGDGVVVAVLDTGYTPHSNFINILAPLIGESCSSSNGKGTTCYGYTFISDCAVSGDPTCNKNPQPQKPDALDWGDYTTVKNVTFKSSWHGSHVAGIIAADGYVEGNGILGGAYGARVLPVRVLGRGGGYTSDVISAILWASGEGTIHNHTPANVINMSLGGPGSCGPAMQAAINVAISKNVVVVAAAGNATCSDQFCSSYNVYNVSHVTPASCNGVISVSAKGVDNNLSWYSSYGNTTITASGGNVYPSSTASLNNVYSDIWNSPYAYESQGSPSYILYEGTSQATPHVSGAIADLISYFKQKGVAYSIPYIIGVLQNSAASLTNVSNYSAKPTTQGQGGSVSGLTLNANNALLYAKALVSSHIVVAPSSWSPTSTISQMFTFTNESSESVTIESYLISGADKSVVITASNNTCIGKTLFPTDSCSILLTLASQGVSYNSLQLFRNAGKIAAFVPINVNNSAPTSAPSGGGGGGGCSAINDGNDCSLIFMLLGLSILYIFRKRCNYK